MVKLLTDMTQRPEKKTLHPNFCLYKLYNSGYTYHKNLVNDKETANFCSLLIQQFYTKNGFTLFSIFGKFDDYSLHSLFSSLPECGLNLTFQSC